MGFKLLVFGGVGLLLLGTIFHIVGMATDDWSLTTIADVTVGVGPWTGDCGCSCGDELNVVRAFTVIGVLFACLSTGVAVFMLLLSLKEDDAPAGMSPMVTAVSGAVAFLFILIGDIVWAASKYYDEDVQDLGYSFALSVVGSILILAGGAISFVGGR